MDKLVSVIIPVYNRTDYLPECFQSVREQSYQNMEIILIDDGSTDGSIEMCRQYAQEDSRVVFIEANHGGVSAARNLGLEAAKGDYILFVDSDDVIHPLLAESLLRSLEDTGAPIGGTRNYLIFQVRWDSVPTLIAQSPGPAETSHQTPEQTLEAFFHGRSPFGVMGGIMIRRDWIGDTRFQTDLFIGEDYYFIYQNLIKGADAVFFKQQWYYYRAHGMNSDRTHNFDAFWSRFYRRKLVWQSEEALGRPEYAKLQKINGFTVYLKAITVNKMSPADQKKMRRVIKDHRKEILPCLRLRGKLRYYLSVYLPFTQRLLSGLRERFKKS